MGAAIQIGGMVGGIAAVLTAVCGVYTKVAVSVTCFRVLISLFLFGSMGFLFGLYLLKKWNVRKIEHYETAQPKPDGDQMTELQPFVTKRLSSEQVNVINHR